MVVVLVCYWLMTHHRIVPLFMLGSETVFFLHGGLPKSRSALRLYSNAVCEVEGPWASRMCYNWYPN